MSTQSNTPGAHEQSNDTGTRTKFFKKLGAIKKLRRRHSHGSVSGDDGDTDQDTRKSTSALSTMDSRSRELPQQQSQVQGGPNPDHLQMMNGDSQQTDADSLPGPYDELVDLTAQSFSKMADALYPSRTASSSYLSTLTSPAWKLDHIRRATLNFRAQRGHHVDTTPTSGVKATDEPDFGRFFQEMAQGTDWKNPTPDPNYWKQANAQDWAKRWIPWRYEGLTSELLEATNDLQARQAVPEQLQGSPHQEGVISGPSTATAPSGGVSERGDSEHASSSELQPQPTNPARRALSFSSGRPEVLNVGGPVQVETLAENSLAKLATTTTDRLMAEIEARADPEFAQQCRDSVPPTPASKFEYVGAFVHNLMTKGQRQASTNLEGTGLAQAHALIKQLGSYGFADGSVFDGYEFKRTEECESVGAWIKDGLHHCFQEFDRRLEEGAAADNSRQQEPPGTSRALPIDPNVAPAESNVNREASSPPDTSSSRSQPTSANSAKVEPRPEFDMFRHHNSRYFTPKTTLLGSALLLGGMWYTGTLPSRDACTSALGSAASTVGSIATGGTRITGRALKWGAMQSKSAAMAGGSYMWNTGMPVAGSWAKSGYEKGLDLAKSAGSSVAGFASTKLGGGSGGGKSET